MATPPIDHPPGITRRAFALLAAGMAAPVLAQAPKPWLADMHSHYTMWREQSVDLVAHMREHRVGLLAWAMVDDSRWTRRTPQGPRQYRDPVPGELWAAFQQEVAQRNQRLANWSAAKVLAPADVDAALAGEPRVVLATEGANFLEGDVSRLAFAHGAGVRHVQLVHFIQSPLGDHQTAEPRHGGLTATGLAVVAECRRLGILVDLAHGTPALVDAALEASPSIPVWSHSWISPNGGDWAASGHFARSLTPQAARKIADRGGVVGLWSVRITRDPFYPLRSIAAYVDEIVRMCELIGPAHVAFGTDMAGAGPNPILSDYADLREVADKLLQRGLSETTMQQVFIGNYARVLKAALATSST